LQVARAELPDIIVCVLMMPRMDGMQFLQTLKNDKMLQHIKVIIFTAKTAEDDMIEAFDSGADAYLTKPISLKYLRTRIDRMVAQNDNAAITSSISKEKKTYNKEEQIFLLRCREIIDDNLKNEDFNIDMLADRLAMSHSSLYKKIKAMTGMSLIEFINDYKIYHAVELMRQGQTNIDAVCEQCGFNDAKNFRQIFKRKMGMSPKQYVQQL
jgi:AraC-like DNA-binding protein